MIDWLTINVKYPHHKPLFGGMVAFLDKDCQLKGFSRSFLQVEGSASATTSIRSGDDYENGQYLSIQISGNPAKFLQGHNLFGVDDLQALAYAMVERVFSALGMAFSGEICSRVAVGDYAITRVDVTNSYALPSEDDVHKWIRAASDLSNLKHRGRGTLTKSTLYFGKHSRYWALKFYAKGTEVKARHHLQHFPVDKQEKMLEWAGNILRCEIVIRSMELKRRGLSRGSAWSKKMPAEIFELYTKKVQVSNNVALPAISVEDLPRGLRAAYILWEQGHDLSLFYKRSMWYRLRKQFLAHDIDIAVVQQKKAQIIPMVRYLEAVPAPIPDWAYEQGLVFVPQARR